VRNSSKKLWPLAVGFSALGIVLLLVISSKGPPSSPREQSPSLTESVSFPTQHKVDISKQPQAPRRTNLPIRLISTASSGDGSDARSSALLAPRNASQDSRAEVYTVGEKISFAPQAEITRILPNRVELQNGSLPEYIELDRASSPSTSPALTAPRVENSKPPLGIPGSYGSTSETPGSMKMAPLEPKLRVNFNSAIRSVAPAPGFGMPLADPARSN